jgi:hypothetical protein
VISVGALTPILVCFHKLEITPPSNFNQSCDGTRCRFDESMEAQQMATTKLSDEEFWAFLEKHPDLRDRFASIVSAVENSEGNLKEADTAEERILEEMRHLGREAMQGWAERQVEVTEQEIRQQPQMHRQGKKNSAGIRNSARSRS